MIQSTIALDPKIECTTAGAAPMDGKLRFTADSIASPAHVPEDKGRGLVLWKAEVSHCRASASSLPRDS